MELPTYTSVFRLRRRLYAVYDWELPVPIGLLEVGVFAGGVIVFAALARLLGIELTAASAWFFVVPPGFLAYLAHQPVADHKQPHAWAATQVRYLLEPRLIHRLADSGPRRLAKARARPAVEEPVPGPPTAETQGPET